MESFCIRSGISQEFSALITPQQNGVVERKNRVIQEMARAMCITSMWLETCVEKSSTLCVIQLTRCISAVIPKRLPMSCGREGNQMLSISESLEVFVSFLRIERM